MVGTLAYKKFKLEQGSQTVLICLLTNVAFEEKEEYVMVI